jgi:hypothetical protein
MTSFLIQSPDIIEGIGSVRAAALKEAGISTIAEMFRAGPRRVHGLCQGAGARQVGKWFCSGMLLRITSLDPDVAEALTEGGIRSIKKLANVDLRKLEEAVAAWNQAGRLTKMPTLYELASFQREAGRLQQTGMLSGRILNRGGEPLTDVLVDIGERETLTDKTGRYAFDQVPAGTVRLEVQVAGRRERLSLGRHVIKPGKLTGPVLCRIPQTPENTLTTTFSHELDGNLVVNRASTKPKLSYLTLNEFRDGTHFEIRHLREDGTARILSLFVLRVGQTIHIQRASVPVTQLPGGVAVGDILVLASGRLQKTNLSRADVAELKRKRWEETHKPASRLLLRLP